ncbi:pyridoxal phosphate-dependent aminotransferase [Homoserinibacter sp. GY 40078]|uniref:pyridoxal phosphate-dependent aminotransferase n=1 Tax=Homoserinibacter sp. GY 40078 TaxID=2603275 RepID=UPI0011CB2F66|nr:pyridoxal phosphate-dependent aminotransferase [Homoserinibacter sp. GY 40078]TXK16967.1 pyridoxal phosphate-dependent aminotransferase [Homoserinibacter sp. GY 40078]
MQQPSAAAATLPASGIREIVNLVVDDPAVRRLEIGEPDAATPPHILEAARRALEGRLGYVQSAGMPVLREAIRDRLERVSGIQAPLERIIVGQGAVQAIAAVMAAVVGPGDEVLVPDPAWPVYEMQAQLLGARPVRYPLRAENGYLPDPDELLALTTPRTRVLVLNSPSNPAGSVAPAALMERLVRDAAARGVLVISDEVYDEMVFDGTHVGAHAFAPDSVVSVFSFSKTYAMTGWRVGYAVVPAPLAVTLERVQETLLSCVPTIAQHAALAALQGPQDSVAANRERYRRRRDAAVAQLAAGGIAAPAPGGAFYLLMPLAPGADSRAAALDLATRGVSVAPGSAFGDVARDVFRLSLGSADDVLAEGIDRILAWYGESDGGLRPTREAAR